MRLRWSSTHLAVAVVLQGLWACSHLAPADGDAVPASNTLETVAVADLGDRLRIEMDRGTVLTYSMSTSEVPTSVTVDLPGLSKGTGLQPLEVNTPPLLQILPQEISTPPGVQLVFLLTTAVKPEVRTEGTRLILDFPKTPAATELTRAEAEGPEAPKEMKEMAEQSPEQDEASAAAEPQAKAEPTIPAKTMTKVEVQRGESEATVFIFGDGEFTYEVRPLNRDRLIVDLVNVASPVRIQVLPVDHPLLKQVRIGHHSHKVRLVLDLPGPAKYAVQAVSDRLIVRLTPPTEPEGSDAAAKPAEGKRAEPREAVPDDKRVRFVTAGRVPFPERLALVQTQPRLAQMAPTIKGAAEPDELGQPRYTGRKISLDFQQADIGNILRLIAEVSETNIVVGEGVKAKVTIRLVNVPWDQALDILLKMNNLGMIREGNIVWIDTLSNISRQQEEEAKVRESKVKAEDLVLKTIYLKNVTAQEIQTTLSKYLSPRGQLTVHATTNALVIQDTPGRVAEFMRLVDGLDIEVPQVQIEARIVQADTAYSRSLGIQWGFTNRNTTRTGNAASFVSGNAGNFGAQTPSGTQDPGFLVNLPAAVSGLTTIPAAGFTFGRLTQDGPVLDLRISAGEFLGLTKVIAAPKISTLDNRAAKISQGESIPFQTTSLQGTQTTFVDANLELEVTPQITRHPKEERKQVLLKIRAARNFVGARSNPAGPSIEKREATTHVLVRDGETAVIGGIFVDEQTSNVSGVPFLSRIPVLGWLFKRKEETIARKELLIFLTPIIVKT